MENFEFFTGSVGNKENNDAEYNIAAPENGNVEDPQMAIDKEAERPQRARRPPDRLNVLTGHWQNLIDAASVAIVNTEEPTTTEEALSNVKSWREAIQSEYDLLKQNQTWDLVDIPASKNIFGTKWIFKHNRVADGEIQ